jgi:phosphoribosylamine--glycine ligase
VINAATALVDASPPAEPPLRHQVPAGGRVLAVRALGYDIADARARAYAAADLISFPGMQRRSDIAAEPLGVIEGAAVLEG